MKAAARAERIAVRSSRRGEETVLGRIGQEAFLVNTIEGWADYFAKNPDRAPDDTLVAEVGGEVVGHATAYRFSMRVAGEDVPVRGVAAVSVAPEARRRGVADRLVREHLRRCRAAGEPLSLLYPFRAPFYAKFGYAITEWVERLRVPPARLPASPLRAHVRRMRHPDDETAVRSLYEKMRHGTGPLRRSEHWWAERVLRRAAFHVVWIDPATSKVAGYLFYDVPAEPAYPSQVCLVKELVAATPAAYRGLVGYLEALGEQFGLVELDAPRGAGAHLLELTGSTEGPPARLYHVAGFTLSGAMLRIVDVAAALAAHPGVARASGRLGLDLEDPVFGASSLDVTLGARAKVEPGRVAKDRLALGIGRLAQVYGGGSSTTALLRQGLLEGSPRAAATLDGALSGPPMFLGRLNSF